MTSLVVHKTRARFVGKPWWVLAFYDPDIDAVHVLRPFHRVFFGLARLAHELEHARGLGHHPWWHFCIRSPYALRHWHHATYWKDTVRAFREGGDL